MTKRPWRPTPTAREVVDLSAEEYQSTRSMSRPFDEIWIRTGQTAHAAVPETPSSLLGHKGLSNRSQYGVTSKSTDQGLATSLLQPI